MSAGPDALVDQALAAVHAAPDLARELAERALAHPAVTELDEVRALWARGTARRELNDLPGARADLEASLERAAPLEGAPIGDICTTLAFVVFYLGDTERAVALLDRAAASSDTESGTIEMQRALLFHRLGDLPTASATYERAVDLLQRAGDVIPAARAHSNLGVLLSQTGEFDRAELHLRRAAEMADEHGQTLLAAAATHNLGFLQSRRGEVIEALECYEEAERQFREAGAGSLLIPLLADRAALLSSMNLLVEAADEAGRALAIGQSTGNTTDLADIALLAGRCRLAAGDANGAREAAGRAAALFAAHGRAAWLPLAELVQAECDEREGNLEGLAARVEAIAQRLRTSGWTSDAITGDVTAGRLYAVAGDADAARRLLRSAAARRSSGPAPERAAAYLATALLHESTGRRNAARRAVSTGLRTLLDNPATLGAIELRAHAIAHGNALAEAGARLAVADGRPRELLSRIESARGMVALLPRPAVPYDPELAALLAALREINTSFRDAVLRPEDRVNLANRRDTLETAIRRRARRTRGADVDERPDLAEALRELADRQLVEYGLLHGRLWCVSVVRGRARMHDLGPIEPVLDGIDSIDMALNRLNRVQSSERSREAAVDTIRAVGSTLQQQLVPQHVLRSEEPLVIVPTGRLHGLAWRALPAFVTRSVSVSPSLFGWMASIRDARRSIDRPRTLLVAGPELAGATAEVEQLAALHDDPVVLDATASTASRCIETLASASLAHFACHGAFRTDNPLFSSLRIADGELNLYDLEQCADLPRTVVLSACNAAASIELRGGALLGMSNALMSLGVSSVIAPLTPVNDERSVDVMVRLHTNLAMGVPPATALAVASVTGDDVDATAAAFVAIGA